MTSLILQDKHQKLGFSAKDSVLAELVQKAFDLQPTVAEFVKEAEQNRRVSEPVIQAMRDAGLLRLMVPEKFGGYEGTVEAHMAVTAALAEACGGTAWVAALLNVCSFCVRWYPDDVQEEVYGENPDALVAGVLATSPDVKRVEGGLRVSGKWYSASGSLHADWVMVGVLETDETGAPVGQYAALIPKSDYRIDDTWFTSGMRASGSNCIVVEDVFVPERRLLNVPAAVNASVSGSSCAPGELAAIAPVFALVLSGAQLGLARAALKFCIDKAPQRGIAYTLLGNQTESVVVQTEVAKAALKIDTAHLLSDFSAKMLDDFASRGEHMELADRAKVRAQTGAILDNVKEAIDTLMTAHGAGSFAEFSPMQKIWRDSNAAARHAVAMSTVGYELYGKTLLGVENTLSPLV